MTDVNRIFGLPSGTTYSYVVSWESHPHDHWNYIVIYTVWSFWMAKAAADDLNLKTLKRKSSLDEEKIK